MGRKSPENPRGFNMPENLLTSRAKTAPAGVQVFVARIEWPPLSNTPDLPALWMFPVREDIGGGLLPEPGE